ncbi:MAG: hypothetical protein AAGE94_11200 [Acidobacteriota bacterium]
MSRCLMILLAFTLVTVVAVAMPPVDGPVDAPDASSVVETAAPSVSVLLGLDTLVTNASSPWSCPTACQPNEPSASCQRRCEDVCDAYLDSCIAGCSFPGYFQCYGACEQTANACYTECSLC